jgi:uncharacterized coiled-coil protein SlyX
MKTQIMFRRVLTVLGLAAALALPPAPVRAQTNDTPQTGRDPRRAAPAQPAAPAPYDLEIANGTFLSGGQPQEQALFRRAIQILRDKHPEANIAMSPKLGDILIRDLKLRASGLDEEMEALRVASEDQFVWNRRAPINGPALYTLEPSEHFVSESAVPRLTQVEVFNMTSYFAHQANAPTNDAALAEYKEKMIGDTKKIIIQTVEMACAPHALIDLQFHVGANLLVVGGTPDSIEVARKIINAMIGQSSDVSVSWPFNAGGFTYTVPYVGDGGTVVGPNGAPVARLNPWWSIIGGSSGGANGSVIGGSFGATNYARAVQEYADRMAAMQSNLVTPEVLQRLRQRRAADDLPNQIDELQKQILELQKKIAEQPEQNAALVEKLKEMMKGSSGGKPTP